MRRWSEVLVFVGLMVLARDAVADPKDPDFTAGVIAQFLGFAALLLVVAIWVLVVLLRTVKHAVISARDKRRAEATQPVFPTARIARAGSSSPETGT